jgi:anti-sigma B factor antagonist
VNDSRSLGARSQMTLSADRPRPDVCVVHVDGDVDMTTAPDLARYLREQTTRPTAHLVLDLAAVGLLSAAGVAVIVRALHDEGGRYGRLHVVGLADSRPARRTLGITGLTLILDLHDTVEALLARLGDA